LDRGYVRTSIGEIHYRSGGQGRPIVLLPPTGRSSLVYTDLMEHLSTGYHVVGLDPPGIGPSAALPSAASVKDISRWLGEALVALHLSDITLYGLHGGNKLATALAISGIVQVKQLVIAGLSHSIVPDPLLRRRLFMAHGYEELSDATRKDKANILKEWIRKYAELSSLWLDKAVLETITSSEAEGKRLATLIDHLQGQASKADFISATLTYAFEDDLKLLTIPTLFLEIITPGEEEHVGPQGPKLQQIVKTSSWQVLHEPDISRHTLEHRAIDIGNAISTFVE
jgi:pimeloyl-ACP methyl ester carboxylesterase